jgi:predicted ATPase with chaperone activity
VSGFSRTIALWGFIALQQFRDDSDIDLCRRVLIAALTLMACSMQFVLPNDTTREAGLVQIAKLLSDRSSCIVGTHLQGRFTFFVCHLTEF